MVFARDGRLVLERRSAAVRQDSVWVGANGAAPELWFTRLSADARRAVFAGWSGAAYFLAMP